MLILLSGCATNTAEIDKYLESRIVFVNTACDWLSVVRISKDDVLTHITALQIYNQNKAIERNCPGVE